tara:strand:+ start:189 stop:701 length:513 start_codon:yes stop_codon:yes gene_type:complete
MLEKRNINNLLIPISLLLIMSFSRLIPHPPNFTPIIAVGILGGYFFKNLNWSLGIVFLSIFLTDLLLGFYPSMLMIYLSLAIIILSFHKLNNLMNFKNLFLYGLSGSVIFFIVSNFGVWMFDGLYEKNLEGLIKCYIMAIPFFKNTLFSTIIFSYSFLFVNNLSKKIFSA